VLLRADHVIQSRVLAPRPGAVPAGALVRIVAFG